MFELAGKIVIYGIFVVASLIIIFYVNEFCSLINKWYKKDYIVVKISSAVGITLIYIFTAIIIFRYWEWLL